MVPEYGWSSFSGPWQFRSAWGYAYWLGCYSLANVLVLFQMRGMARRSPPQRKLDERAFPIRVKFSVPPLGTIGVAPDMYKWLESEVGRGRYAVHPTETVLWNAFAIHFVAVEDARAFVAAHPQLQLADGTDCVTYTSPYRRLD